MTRDWESVFSFWAQPRARDAGLPAGVLSLTLLYNDSAATQPKQRNTTVNLFAGHNTSATRCAGRSHWRSGLPAGLPAVSGSASHFLTR